MIIVRLWGGLGNQMFQYACGYALAKKNNTNLLLDTRFFTNKFIDENPHFTRQQLNIEKLSLEYREHINENNELSKICKLQNRTVSRLIRLPNRFSIRIDGVRYEKETRLKYLPYIMNKSDDDVYLDGYWQCEKYFSDFKNELKKQYLYSSDRVLQYIQNLQIDDVNTVAVHIRLGDYSDKKMRSSRYNSIIRPDYYMHAIKEMKKRKDEARFFIFSNDIERAKILLGNSVKYTIVNEDRKLSDMEEFQVMSACGNHIISNSTFSWWAAWLSKNEKGIKIAPDVFFGNAEIIPSDWIKIKTE